MTDDAYRPDADPAADDRGREARDDDERADHGRSSEGDDREGDGRDGRNPGDCGSPADPDRSDEERTAGTAPGRRTRALELVALARAVAETLLALVRLMKYL